MKYNKGRHKINPSSFLDLLPRDSLTKGKAPALTYKNYARNASLSLSVRERDLKRLRNMSSVKDTKCRDEMDELFECWRETNYGATRPCTAAADALEKCAGKEPEGDTLRQKVTAQSREAGVLQQAIRNHRHTDPMFNTDNVPVPLVFTKK
eukprot:155874_1